MGTGRQAAKKRERDTHAGCGIQGTTCATAPERFCLHNVRDHKAGAAIMRGFVCEATGSPLRSAARRKYVERAQSAAWQRTWPVVPLPRKAGLRVSLARSGRPSATSWRSPGPMASRPVTGPTSRLWLTRPAGGPATPRFAAQRLAVDGGLGALTWRLHTHTMVVAVKRRSCSGKAVQGHDAGHRRRDAIRGSRKPIGPY